MRPPQCLRARVRVTHALPRPRRECSEVHIILLGTSFLEILRDLSYDRDVNLSIRLRSFTSGGEQRTHDHESQHQGRGEGGVDGAPHCIASHSGVATSPRRRRRACRERASSLVFDGSYTLPPQQHQRKKWLFANTSMSSESRLLIGQLLSRAFTLPCGIQSSSTCTGTVPGTERRRFQSDTMRRLMFHSSVTHLHPVDASHERTKGKVT